MNLKRFNKLWMFLVGLGLVALQKKYGVDLLPVQEEIVELAIAGLTAILIYAVPNIKKEPQ